MKPSAWIALGSLLAAGCVSTARYNAKAQELADAVGRERALVRDNQSLRSADAATRKKLADTQARAARLEEAERDLAAASGERDQLRQKLDEATALTGELKARLARVGQNVDRLTSEHGQLRRTLDEMNSRLDELRRQEAAAEQRAATYRQLVRQLHAMIDSGALKVAIRDGRMLIVMPNDVLFDSGRTEIKTEGRHALAEVARVLAGISGRDFVVAGHTDDVPIHTARFPSNWELSTARAVEVTRFLIGSGMKPQVLSASGYGEFDPVTPNDTAEHRALNRRIEIVLQPNLSELPTLRANLSSQR